MLNFSASGPRLRSLLLLGLLGGAVECRQAREGFALRAGAGAYHAPPAAPPASKAPARLQASRATQPATPRSSASSPNEAKASRAFGAPVVGRSGVRRPLLSRSVISSRTHRPQGGLKGPLPSIWVILLALASLALGVVALPGLLIALIVGSSSVVTWAVLLSVALGGFVIAVTAL